MYMHSWLEEKSADVKDLKNSIWNIDLFDSKNERKDDPSVVIREYRASSGLITRSRQQDLLTPSIEMDDGRGVLGPSPGQILQALTLAAANEGFDLERLEVMGDSILKLATTIRIYCQSPSHFHEGKMTHLRVRQVSNFNLFRLARNKSLPHLMTATKFLPKDNWLPTSYQINPDQVYNPSLIIKQ